jgi:hypothetical protein
MIKSTLVINMKTWRLLFVERTESDKATPAALKPDYLLNDGDQRGLAADSLNGL